MNGLLSVQGNRLYVTFPWLMNMCRRERSKFWYICANICAVWVKLFDCSIGLKTRKYGTASVPTEAAHCHPRYLMLHRNRLTYVESIVRPCANRSNNLLLKTRQQPCADGCASILPFQLAHPCINEWKTCFSFFPNFKAFIITRPWKMTILFNKRFRFVNGKCA